MPKYHEGLILRRNFRGYFLGHFRIAFIIKLKQFDLFAIDATGPVNAINIEADGINHGLSLGLILATRRTDNGDIKRPFQGGFEGDNKG